MSFSFGTDLWDKLEAVITFNENNSIIIDRFQKIISEFCKAQVTISSTQKRLIEKFLAENDALKKSKFNFSSNAYFLTEQVLDILNAHETFGDALLNEVDVIMKTKGANIKKESKLMKNEKKKLFDDLEKENQKLENDLKKCRKRYYERDAAEVASIKAEDNKALSRNQVDNFHSIFNIRKCQCDDAVREYMKILESFNKFQANHYSHSLGEWGLKAQTIEEERYNIMKSTFTNLAEICRSFASKFNEIADSIECRMDTIDCEKDCLTLVNQEKTGDVPPQDILPYDFESKDKLDNGLNDARTSKISNSGSDSTTSNNDQKINKLEIQKKSLSLSRIYSSLINKDNGPTNSGLTTNSSKIFGKLFGGSKRNKEISVEIIPSEIENLELHLKQKYFNNNETNSKEETQQEETKLRETAPTIVNCIEPRKSDQQRRIWLFQTMKYPSRNKSLDDTNVSVRIRSFFGRLNRSHVQSHYEKRRSKSISTIMEDETDNIKLKRTIRFKKLSFSIDKKCPKPVIRRIISSENKKSSSNNGVHTNIEVLRVDGPVEIVSTPAEALASVGKSNSGLKSECEEFYADDEISPITESAAFSYCYIGSCVAIHEYESLDTSKLYLSFNVGDQFYIIQDNDSRDDSGWLLVEKIDRSQSGYVPTSYMDKREFDTAINITSHQPIGMT